MFCAIWVGGPAAGPIGVAAGRRPTITDKSMGGSPWWNFPVGMSKMRCRVSHSWATRPRWTFRGYGVSEGVMGPHLPEVAIGNWQLAIGRRPGLAASTRRQVSPPGGDATDP